MNSNTPERLIFLDYDGCITSRDEGNYFNPDPDKYHPSKKIVSLLKDFCEDERAKIVISSNWRKFDIDGEWKCAAGIFKNPLTELTQMLGDCIYGTLPSTRHIKKPQALINWMSDSNYNGKFVVLDDDLYEGFQDTVEFNIKDNFILVDCQHGITSRILEKAKELFLKR